MTSAVGDERLRTALLELDAITRRLRRECPWDREQDERSIVPHTVEEAYELVDAAHAGDDARLLDELGDVLFQVYFLSLLLEERGAGDLAAVATATREKLAGVERARHHEPPGSHHGSPELYEAVGNLLLAVVALASEVGVDPEIALRRAAVAA